MIEQRLRPLGYCGGHSILQCYVRKVRPHAPKRAFVRMEPLAGERFEVDWGHFGALSYSGAARKLYAFALVDAHSSRRCALQTRTGGRQPISRNNQ